MFVCLNFINHLAYKAYSHEFLSFVAHKMVSPHTKDEPKREQERKLAMWGEGSESNIQSYQNISNKTEISPVAALSRW